MNAENAVYLLGGFGGATKSIIEIISGGKPHQLTNQFQFDTDFSNQLRDYVYNKLDIKLDYDYLFDFFKNHPIETIAKQNGLSIEENRILFESTNIHELIFLIIKGLRKIISK